MRQAGATLSLWIATAWFASGGKMSAENPGNLLPPLDVITGTASHWEVARNQEAAVESGSQMDENGKAALALKLSNEAGYGEWRVSPMLAVQPGNAYQARVRLSGYAEAAPYLEVYAYGEEGKPRLIGRAAGRAGQFQDDVLQCRFATPQKAERLRFGVGLSRAKGEFFIKEATLGPAGEESKDPVMEKAASPAPSADWIWITPDPGVPTVIFRKQVTLERAPATAFVQITADNAYQLLINGKPICADGNWKTLEVRDAAAAFVPGENTIEIRVDNYDDVGGVLFHARLRNAGEKAIDISTDASWAATQPDGRALSVSDLGPAPHAPWKTIVLADVEPPTPLRAEVVEQTKAVRAGDILRVDLRLKSTAAPALKLGECRMTVEDNRGPVSVSGVPAYVLVKDDRLSVELPISLYAMPGAYRLRLTGRGFVIDADLAPFEITANRSIPPAPAAWWPMRNGNVVETRGGAQAPFSYASILQATAERYQAWQTTGGHLYEIEADASADYKGTGEWDIARIEKQLLQILSADPLACVQLRVRVDMPSWWIDQNPDESFRSNAGRRGKQSFASKKWRAEATAAVTSLVHTLWQRPAGVCLGGVLLCAFRGGEFQLWGEETGEYDISPVAQTAFRRWQLAHGAGESELITLPHPALTLPFPPGEANARVRESYFRFLAEHQGENIAEISRRIKEALGPEFPITVYYGYIFEHAGTLRRLLFGGGLGFQKVADSPAINAISCPASYALRGPDEPHAFMYPVTSVRLHGKMPVLEDDIRNFLSPHASDSSGERLHDLANSILSLRKLRWLAATQGATVRYLTAFGDPVDTMQDPSVLAELAALNRTVMTLAPAEVGAAGQIAFVVDPQALYKAGELPPELVRAALSEVRRDLAEVPRPVAFLTMVDWLNHSSDWQTVILPLPALLDKATRHHVEAAFGQLAATDSTTAFLLLEKGKEAVECANAAELRQRLGGDDSATPRYWYLGGNFQAWADRRTGELSPAMGTKGDAKK